MVTVTSLQDVRVAGGGGHIILVRANTPADIPDELLPIAAKLGCAVVGPAPAPVVKSPRQKLIDCVTTILDTDDDPEHFKIDGTPKLIVVKRLLGAEVTQNEIYDVYSKIILDRKFSETEDTE